MLSIEELRSIFKYESETGRLYRHPKLKHTNTFAQNEALRQKRQIITSARVKINRKLYSTSQIIWAIHYGYWPERPLKRAIADSKGFFISHFRYLTNDEMKQWTKRDNDTMFSEGLRTLEQSLLRKENPKPKSTEKDLTQYPRYDNNGNLLT